MPLPIFIGAKAMRHKHKRASEPLERCEPLRMPKAIMKHVIARGETAKREYYLHATKGYRSRANQGE